MPKIFVSIGGLVLFIKQWFRRMAKLS